MISGLVRVLFVLLFVFPVSVFIGDDLFSGDATSDCFFDYLGRVRVSWDSMSKKMATTP